MRMASCGSCDSLGPLKDEPHLVPSILCEYKYPWIGYNVILFSCADDVV